MAITGTLVDAIDLNAGVAVVGRQACTVIDIGSAVGSIIPRCSTVASICVDAIDTCWDARCAVARVPHTVVNVIRTVGAHEAHGASAGVRPNTVHTSSTVHARGRCTFISVGAGRTVARVPVITSASVLTSASAGDRTQGVGIAGVHRCGTVVVHHVAAISTAPTICTDACVRRNAVHTGGAVLTRCGRAVVYVGLTRSTVPPYGTGACEGTDSVDACPVAAARLPLAFVDVVRTVDAIPSQCAHA